MMAQGPLIPRETLREWKATVHAVVAGLGRNNNSGFAL